MKSISLILIIALFFIKFSAPGQANFLWAKSMGGTGIDVGSSIAVDATGNVYTTGAFQGTVDFDPGVGVFNLTSAGLNDIFISKLDATGNFVWVKQMGGISNEAGNFITVDVAGNVYTTGDFSLSADFDPSASVFNLTAAGGLDIFISKLDAAGNFVWAKSMGGGSFDIGTSINVDGSGNVYTTGTFSTTADFDPGAGFNNLTSTGLNDIFVSKLNASGAFVWAKQMGGTGDDYGQSVTVDGTGNVYTTGYFFGTADFDPGVGVYTITSSGSSDIFVNKLDASGTFIWAKSMGGAGFDKASSITIDGTGNICTTGVYNGTADFDPSVAVYTITSSGNEDIFISKLDAAGTFVWAKGMGGAGFDRGYSISTDVSGNIYVTGYYMGTADFDPGVGVYNLTSVGNEDIFISKIDASGAFILAKSMGGISSDYGNSIFIDGTGYIYVAGGYNGTADFDPGATVYNLTSNGNQDVYVLKLGGPTGIDEKNNSSNSVIVFPNPNSGSFNLQINNTIENGEIVLINSLGQEVHEQKIVQGINNINIKPDKSEGRCLFHYVITESKKQINNGKIVIE